MSWFDLDQMTQKARDKRAARPPVCARSCSGHNRNNARRFGGDRKASRRPDAWLTVDVGELVCSAFADHSPS